jgi:hypothetical protein
LVDRLTNQKLEREADTLRALDELTDEDDNYYRIPRPGLLWNGTDGELLPADGGKKRPVSVKTHKGKKASPSKGSLPPLPYSIAASEHND